MRARHRRREDLAVTAEHRIGRQRDDAERDRGAEADAGALGAIELGRAPRDDVLDLLRVGHNDEVGAADQDLADGAQRACGVVEEVAARAGRRQHAVHRREVARRRERPVWDAG